MAYGFPYDDAADQGSVLTVLNPKSANISIGGFTPTFVIKPINSYKNSSSKVPTFINNFNSASQFSSWIGSQPNANVYTLNGQALSKSSIQGIANRSHSLPSGRYLWKAGNENRSSGKIINIK